MFNLLQEEKHCQLLLRQQPLAADYLAKTDASMIQFGRERRASKRFQACSSRVVDDPHLFLPCVLGGREWELLHVLSG